MQDLLGEAAKRFFAPTYLDDPTQWAYDRLDGVHFWSMQRRIAQSVVKNRYTSVRSAHDGGKSFLCACLACWWLDAHPVGESFVVSTAPTGAQVSAILWREIERLH